MKKLILFYFVATSMLLTFTLSASALDAEFYLQKPTSSNHVAEVRFRNVNIKDTIFLTLKYKNYDKKIKIFDTISKNFTVHDTSYYEGGVEEHCIFGEIQMKDDLPYAIIGACFEKYEKEKVLRIIQNPISIFTVEDETIDLRFGVNNSTPNEPFLVTLKFLFEDKANKISTIKDTSFFVLNERNVSFTFDYTPKERGRFLYELKVSNSFTFDNQNGDYFLNPPLPSFTMGEKSIIMTKFHYKDKGNLRVVTDGRVLHDGEVYDEFEFLYPEGEDIEAIATDLLGGETRYKIKSLKIDLFGKNSYFIYDYTNINGVRLDDIPTNMIFIEKKIDVYSCEYFSRKGVILK